MINSLWKKRRMGIEKREEKEKSRGCLMCIPVLPRVHFSKLRISLLMSNPSLPSLSPLSYFLSHHNGKKKKKLTEDTRRFSLTSVLRRMHSLIFFPTKTAKKMGLHKRYGYKIVYNGLRLRKSECLKKN